MNTMTLIRTIRRSCADLIDQLEPIALDVMQNGQRADRWLTLLPGGEAVFTMRDYGAIQIEIPAVLDLDRLLTGDEVQDALAYALSDAIATAETQLIDTYTGEEIREATPEELLESWLAGPEGHIEAEIEGEARTVYAEI